MARLPSGNLIQQIEDVVIVFEEGTEREFARFALYDSDGNLDVDGIGRAQRAIHDSDLSDEDKAWAHFWSGYFYAHAAPLIRHKPQGAG